MSIVARLTVDEYGRMLIAGVFDQGRMWGCRNKRVHVPSLLSSPHGNLLR